MTHRGKKEIRLCKNCGQEFEALLIKIRVGKALFCSHNCYIEYRKRNKREQSYAQKMYKIKTLYKISQLQFEEFLHEQNNSCAICKNEFKTIAEIFVDHNHLTNKVRGLLCSNCNAALGMFKDNPSNLVSAIQYLN